MSNFHHLAPWIMGLLSSAADTRSRPQRLRSHGPYSAPLTCIPQQSRRVSRDKAVARRAAPSSVAHRSFHLAASERDPRQDHVRHRDRTSPRQVGAARFPPSRRRGPAPLVSRVDPRRKSPSRRASSARALPVTNLAQTGARRPPKPPVGPSGRLDLLPTLGSLGSHGHLTPRGSRSSASVSRAPSAPERATFPTASVSRSAPHDVVRANVHRSRSVGSAPAAPTPGESGNGCRPHTQGEMQ